MHLTISLSAIDGLWSQYFDCYLMHLEFRMKCIPFGIWNVHFGALGARISNLIARYNNISWIQFWKKQNSPIICYSSGTAYIGWTINHLLSKPIELIKNRKNKIFDKSIYNFMQNLQMQWILQYSFFIWPKMNQKFKRKWICIEISNFSSTAHIYSHCVSHSWNTIYTIYTIQIRNSNEKTENSKIEMTWRMSTGISA